MITNLDGTVEIGILALKHLVDTIDKLNALPLEKLKVYDDSFFQPRVTISKRLLEENKNGLVSNVDLFIKQFDLKQS